MQRREFLTTVSKAAVGVAGFMALGNTIQNIGKTDKPINFVYILADDMGWNQTGYGGSTFYETPNIDKIAYEGMYFTNAYAPAPTCSPSRAGILTGRYPARLHLTEFIPPDPFPWARLKAPKMVESLPLSEITIAEMLKQKGYVSAMIGKWHLNKDKHYKLGRPGDPMSQGFDFVHTTVKPKYSANPNKDAHHAIEITNEALKFLDKYHKKPFFLYVAHNVVHRPIMEHADLILKYQEKMNSDLAMNNPIEGAMIERMDTEIGILLKKIDDLGLRDNTVVVFFSDNGGFFPLQAQDPLRGGKSLLYEGGIRVPFAIRWPGVIKSGTKSDVPVIGCDFFPTFGEIAGVKKFEHIIDGLSLVSLMKNGSKLNRKDLFWHFPHYHKFSYKPCGAIREGDYKLIEWYERSILHEKHPVSLFNLKEDIGERNDLADKMPDKANDLWKKLKQWRKDVGAQEMTINPNYDPKKALYWNTEVDPNSANAEGVYH